MEILLDAVKSRIDNLGELRNEFEKYGKVYLTTTENIKGILSGINLTNKDILTVAGSGDQALNAYFKGAKTVTLFDVNPLALAQAELKITAASKLEYPAFCEFFIPGSGNVFNPKSFDKIAPNLSDEVVNYYDYLYSHFKPIEIFDKTVFAFYPTTNKIESLNNYMNEEAFKQLKEILEDKEPMYIESSLLDLPVNLENMYDMMLLSNISDSLEEIWNINTLKCYKRFIHVLSKNLNRNGIIQCGYIYHSYRNQKNIPIFSNNAIRRKIFTEDEFKEKDVQSFQLYGSTDKVITYQKKRRKVA